MNQTDAESLKMMRYHVEHQQKWVDEGRKIPYLQFRGDWQVQVIPPFGDAVIRFAILLPSGQRKSVYLDARNSLGYWRDDGTPYWEVYPYRGDVGRCDMDDTVMLMEMIYDESEREDGEDNTDATTV